MKSGDNLFSTVLKKFLNERLSTAEEQSLKDEGFNIEKPTRKVAIIAALYKKAASGDLSAIKELRSMAGDTQITPNERSVKIIDDLGNQTFTDGR